MKQPMYKIVISNPIYSMSEDYVILLAMPQKERFRKIQEEYPWILNDKRIKDYMIAGYLGIDKTMYGKYKKGRINNNRFKNELILTRERLITIF